MTQSIEIRFRDEASRIAFAEAVSSIESLLCDECERETSRATIHRNEYARDRATKPNVYVCPRCQARIEMEAMAYAG